MTRARLPANRMGRKICATVPKEAPEQTRLRPNAADRENGTGQPIEDEGVETGPDKVMVRPMAPSISEPTIVAFSSRGRRAVASLLSTPFHALFDLAKG